MGPKYIQQRKIHLYHCDRRDLPLALVNAEGKADWSAEYDAWGNVLSENNPHNLKQLIRFPEQQYDEEMGLYYNRYHYYNSEQGWYITQEPIGLQGGRSPLFCALCSSRVLKGIGPFKIWGEIGTPWGMKEVMSNLRYPKPNKPWGSWFISPAY